MVSWDVWTELPSQDPHHTFGQGGAVIPQFCMIFSVFDPIWFAEAINANGHFPIFC